MKINKLIAAFLLMGTCLYGQNIQIDFPFHAGKPVVLTLKNGIKNDTIYNNKFDDSGKVNVTLPAARKNYAGMASLNLENGGGLDFVVNRENLIIRSSQEYPYGENVIFENSPENSALQLWFVDQAVRQQKIGLLGELKKSYTQDTGFSQSLNDELLLLQNEQQSFEKMLDASDLYSAQFIKQHNFLSRRVSSLLFADSLQRAQVRAFVKDSLNVDYLYTSGLWFDTLNGLLALYDNDTPYHYNFVDDMSLLLKRSKHDEVYMGLAEDLFAICESTGWNGLEEQLAYFVANEGRISNPTGRLKMLLTLFKLTKGSPAPALSQGELPAGKFLLVFYESGCGSCENEMEMFKTNYPLLKERGVEVVSVSADKDKDVFRNVSQLFPWSYKYCDFEGFDGINFKNYGVIGSPTIYLIDENRIIQGRYARLADTGLLF